MNHENTSQAKQPEVMPSATVEDEIPFGGDLFLIQPKLTVGDVDDPLEREADAVADQVMRTDTQPFIQRKCAHCEEEERVQRKPVTDFISRKATENSSQPVSSQVSQGIQNENGKGSSMQGPVMDFMESRFSADFSDVNIHTGARATDLTAQLKAQAFTVGNDIYFNEGKYSPETDSGKHLLAHELTHTIQQGNNKLIQRTGETGTSIDTNNVWETVPSAIHPGVTRGMVIHSQYRNEADRAAGNYFHRSFIDLRFDENECKVYVSRTVQFVHEDDTHRTRCSNVDGGVDDPMRRVSDEDFRRIANRFLRANNEGLNDWFKIHLRNAPACPCNDRDIPIIVEVTETETNPDSTVIITGNSGRSYVSGDETRRRVVLCDNPDYETMVHEGAHMTLGYDDEYRERPRGAAERERTTDFSYLAGHTRLSIFHERHFDFVRAFMENLYPGSQATLIFGSRSRYVPSFTIGGAFGGAGGDYAGLFYSIGLEMNIPLDVLRRMEISIGPRLGLLVGDVMGSRESMTAILYGVRLAFLGTFDTRLFNEQVPLGVGVHLEGGGGHNFQSSITAPDFRYMEFGASLGYRGNQLMLGLEGGVGALDLDAAPGAPDMTDPRVQTYVRFGISAAYRF